VTPDGGEGLFVAGAGRCGASDDDGGSKIADQYDDGSHDGKGTCWYRQNINGDLRQFGATKGSSYDCSGAGIDTCTAADGTPNILLNAQTAAKNAGVRRVTTSGIQIRLASSITFTVDGNMVLDGGVGSPDVSNHTISVPGTIWTSDTATVGITLSSDAVAQNVAFMPYWIGKYLYDSGPDITYPNQLAIISHMVNTGQTGVTCVNPNCEVRNAVVAGYDTAIEASGSGTLLADIVADGDACIYFHDSGSGTHWRNINCGPKSTADGVSEEYFSVIGVADDGSSNHRCVLTLDPTAPNFSDISTGYYVWVSGLNANTGANADGRWLPSSVDSVHGTVTLGDSLCSNASGTLNGPSFSSASYTAGTYVIRLPSALSTATANIKEGQTVSSSVMGDIPNNTVVKSVARSMSCYGTSTTCVMVGISKAINGSSSTATVQFSSTSTSSSFTPCVINVAVGSTGSCLIVTAQERVDVGKSAGGLAASGYSTSIGPGCATAFLVGGFSSSSTGPALPCQAGMSASEKASGFDILSPFCYAYAVCYHFANAYNVRLISPGMDATRNLGSDNTAFGIVDGGFKGIAILGGVSGKSGAGLIINPSGADKGCVNIDSNDLSGFEVDQGCLLGRGLDSANTLMVWDNALAVQLSGYSPNLNMYTQDTPSSGNAASSITDTSGMLQTKIGSPWWGGQFAPGGVAPTLSGTGTGGPTSATGNDSVGRFTLGTVGIGTMSVLTFSHPWANAPVCRAWDQASTASLPVTAGTSAITIGGTLTSGHTVAYQCIGYSN
jgi:hypothetical protein